jgi:hypothetical protein
MKSLAILTGLSALAMAAPAAAQKASPAAYKATVEFADCVLAKSPADAQAVLASTPGTGDEKAAIGKVAGTTGCSAKPKNDVLRGALAERVYLATYTAAPAERVGDLPPFTGSGNVALVNWDVTRCAAERDPVGADMLVRSEPRSAGEGEALKRFVSSLSSCLPGGATLGFGREVMRGLVAEGLIAVRKAGTN